MKKFFMLSCLLTMALAASAQNLQLHYDFGRHIYSDDEGSRQSVTATFEQFKADKLGSWYYFIDLDIDRKGMSGAYTEISREFTFVAPTPKSSFAAHVEYDGGLSRGFSFQQAGLIGAAWNFHSSDFSKTCSLQAMYKQFFGHGGMKAYSSFQITGVWGLNFAKNKCTFSGFFDVWQEKNNAGRYLVFLSEPQLWYNFTKHFSAGTEIELSNNFIYSNHTGNNDKFYVNPTLAVKYNF